MGVMFVDIFYQRSVYEVALCSCAQCTDHREWCTFLSAYSTLYRNVDMDSIPGNDTTWPGDFNDDHRTLGVILYQNS